MTRGILRGAGLLCAALALGLTLAHVLELPGKRTLDGAQWLAMQHALYGGFAVVGGIAEVCGLAAALLSLVVLRGDHAEVAGAAIAAACFAGMLLAYFLGNRPINALIAAWTPATLPMDWTAYRDRWDTYHAISTALAAVAFVALLIATLAEAPRTARGPSPRRAPRRPRMATDRA